MRERDCERERTRTLWMKAKGKFKAFTLNVSWVALVMSGLVEYTVCCNHMLVSWDFSLSLFFISACYCRCRSCHYFWSCHKVLCTTCSLCGRLSSFRCLCLTEQFSRVLFFCSLSTRRCFYCKMLWGVLFSEHIIFSNANWMKFVCWTIFR